MRNQKAREKETPNPTILFKDGGKAKSHSDYLKDGLRAQGYEVE